jgi:hypothetical protein
MISFEWYVARAKINLEVFFETQKINSDEELRVYCESKKMIPPTTKYFQVEELVITELPTEPKKPVAKTTRRKSTKKTKAEDAVTKKPKTTRRRNTRTSKK